MAAAYDIRLDVSIDVEAVIATARGAGDVILAIYNGEADAWAVEQKADNSPLTRADKEANELICGARWREVLAGGCALTATLACSTPGAPGAARAHRERGERRHAVRGAEELPVQLVR